MTRNLLLVVADAAMRQSFESQFREQGYVTHVVDSLDAALQRLRDAEFDAVLFSGPFEPDPLLFCIERTLGGAAKSQLSLRDLEERYIDEVLRATGGNKVQAARILGVDRKTLYRRAERRRADAEPKAG